MVTDWKHADLSGLDRDVQLEILGYRDTIIGQKATIANLEWRLEEVERRLRASNRHRDDMVTSMTWRIGRLVMKVAWPLRKVRAILVPRSATPRK